jgi:serine/threonine protein kinase
MPFLAGTKIGPCEIVALIGAGGIGGVYRTKDNTLKRDVALKVLPDGFSYNSDRMARFQREAEVLASLDHPKIGHIHGICESQDAS